MSKPKSGFKNLLIKLGADDPLAEAPRKEKEYTAVKSQTAPHPDYNYMADLLELPKTKQGYRYLLVVVDLWTDLFDIEPLKSKTPATVLTGFKTIFKRPFLDKPYASVQTDGGAEFKGAVNKYFFEESILHRITMKGRHTQNSVVERLNGIIGELLNNLMNQREKKTGRIFREWTEFVPEVRTELNRYRKERRAKIKPDQHDTKNDYDKKPKFKPDQVVRYALSVPRNALGNEQNTPNFRKGDIRWSEPKKIKQIMYVGGKIGWRYMLEGIENASYTEKQLKAAESTEKETKYRVKRLIDRRTRNKKIEYLVWWVGYLKKESTWEPKKQLIEDGFQQEIDDYEKQQR